MIPLIQQILTRSKFPIDNKHQNELHEDRLGGGRGGGRKKMQMQAPTNDLTGSGVVRILF